MQIAEYLPATPAPIWSLMRQIDVTHAVVPLPFGAAGSERPWDFTPLLRMTTGFRDAGFTVSVIESSPPMDHIRLGTAERDTEIADFCTMIENMGALGIPVVCYNFMARLGWTRTSFAVPARGGALVSGYDHTLMRHAPLTDAGEVSEEQLWENLHYFLRRVLPVAERAGVKLAMHPDDPPLSPLRGIGRIMRSIDNFQRLIDLVPSSSNGITLCQGNFALMTDDLPRAIRQFGHQQKIFFVHMRDVRGTAEQFVETFHDDGPTDLLACFRAYREVGFDGVLRPDHVPTMAGEQNDAPGYETLGRLFAVGYLKGLRTAAYQ
ncbi:MAG TPA: mannonate dehydratase [Roseiflexaceae bacterium]|nr:mannonate dehydratase [Roseiflexaceae bacterium]